MKQLTAAEIHELADDELRDYCGYLRRVDSHERGAAAERKRIAAELHRRNLSQNSAPAIPEEQSLEEMLAADEQAFEEMLAADFERLLDYVKKA